MSFITSLTKRCPEDSLSREGCARRGGGRRCRKDRLIGGKERKIKCVAGRKEFVRNGERCDKEQENAIRGELWRKIRKWKIGNEGKRWENKLRQTMEKKRLKVKNEMLV